MKRFFCLILAWALMLSWLPAHAETNGPVWFVRSEKSDTPAPLYAALEETGVPLGVLYAGTEVEMLQEAPDGWAHIGLCSVEGYMRLERLEAPASGTPAYRPPLALLQEGQEPEMRLPKKGSGDTYLNRYDPAWVLGRFGNEYLVRTETWISESETGYVLGFVPVSAFIEGPLQSASTLASALRDTALYHWPAPDRPEPTGDILPQGAAFTVVSGCGSFPDEGAEWYLTQDDQYLCILTYTPDGTAYANWVRLEDVWVDPGLFLPEIMNLG